MDPPSVWQSLQPGLQPTQGEQTSGGTRTYLFTSHSIQVAGKDDETGEDLVQREDDKAESVRNRLEVFKASTAPVLDFYREKGILADFQGTESKKIWPHVEKYLRSLDA